ncbi:MAG: hypothetical protein BHW02_05960 [Clostridium sp. 28_12]|nr:MAG: hypothetical protein BHW02_05960 [Clostridium sp. 28_12]
MNEFKVIEVMNRAKIEVLKDKKEDYSLNQKIQEYLKDETLFFRINKEKAYKILQTIGVKKELLEEVYKKLINQDVYYDLLNRGKIKDDDESVIVKYKVYRAK